MTSLKSAISGDSIPNDAEKPRTDQSTRLLSFRSAPVEAIQVSEGRREDGLLEGVDVIRGDGLHEVTLVGVHRVGVLRSEDREDSDGAGEGNLRLQESLSVIEVEATIEQSKLGGELVVDCGDVHEFILCTG